MDLLPLRKRQVTTTTLGLTVLVAGAWFGATSFLSPPQPSQDGTRFDDFGRELTALGLVRLQTPRTGPKELIFDMRVAEKFQGWKATWYILRAASEDSDPVLLAGSWHTGVAWDQAPHVTKLSDADSDVGLFLKLVNPLSGVCKVSVEYFQVHSYRNFAWRVDLTEEDCDSIDLTFPPEASSADEGQVAGSEVESLLTAFTQPHITPKPIVIPPVDPGELGRLRSTRIAGPTHGWEAGTMWMGLINDGIDETSQSLRLFKVRDDLPPMATVLHNLPLIHAPQANEPSSSDPKYKVAIVIEETLAGVTRHRMHVGSFDFSSGFNREVTLKDSVTDFTPTQLP